MGLIDVDKAKHVIMDEIVAPDWFKTVACMALSNMPAVDSVKHGYWISYHPKLHDSVYEGLFMCSECKLWAGSCTNYCPTCGTKNDGAVGE